MLERYWSAGFSRRAAFSFCDHRQQRAVEGALAQLVLLRVQVLLAARFDRRVLEALEAGVDAVGRRERRGEDEARLEGRRAALDQVLGEDVRGVGEEVGPAVVGGLVGEVVDVLGQLPARVLPGEVGVGLAEAELREGGQLRPPGEGLGEEDHVRVGGADLGDQPLPERQRLGVRVVDAEDADAALDPEQDDRRGAPPRGRASPRSRSSGCRCPGSASAGSRRTSGCRRGGG